MGETGWEIQEFGTSGHFIVLPWEQNGRKGYQKAFRVDGEHLYVWHKGYRRDIPIPIQELQKVCSAL